MGSSSPETSDDELLLTVEAVDMMKRKRLIS
jgi:hypothetical protein